MEDANKTLSQETWYDVSYFNIDEVKEIVANSLASHTARCDFQT